MILKKEINKINKIDRILSIKDNIITANGLSSIFLEYKNIMDSRKDLLIEEINIKLYKKEKLIFKYE